MNNAIRLHKCSRMLFLHRITVDHDNDIVLVDKISTLSIPGKP